VIAKHFKIEELVDKNTFQNYGNDAWLLLPNESIEMIDGIREFFDAPVTCNDWIWGGKMQFRGYRPLMCKVGARNSYHKKGMAFDFDVKGLSAEEARKRILDDQDNHLLKNITRMEDRVSWVHVDSGELKDWQERIHVFLP